MEKVDKLACDIQDLHNTLSYYIEEGLIRDTEMNMRVDILTTQVGELNTSIRGLRRYNLYRVCMACAVWYFSRL